MSPESRPQKYQNEALPQINYKEISRGAEISETIVQYLLRYMEEGGFVVDAGCGPGDKTKKRAEEWEEKFWTLIGVDKNPSAIVYANEEAQGVDNLEFLELDMTNWDLFNELNRFVFIRAVLAQALFCNLIGNDAETAMETFSLLVGIGGYVAIADCMRIDRNDEAMMTQLASFDWDSINMTMEKYIDEWEKRYGENNKLEGVEDGTFYVMKPGVDKEKEFGNAKELQELLEAGLFERVARHWRREEFEKLCEKYGFEIVIWEDTLWTSRTGQPLPGMQILLERTTTVVEGLEVGVKVPVSVLLDALELNV